MRKFLLAMLAIAVSALMIAPSSSYAATKGGFEKQSDAVTIDKRRKPRVPGGSGCDDPDDVIEHPECRG